MLIDITIDTESKQIRSTHKLENEIDPNRKVLLSLLSVLKDLKEYSFVLDEVNMEEALDNFKYLTNIEIGN